MQAFKQLLKKQIPAFKQQQNLIKKVKCNYFTVKSQQFLQLQKSSYLYAQQKTLNHGLFNTFCSNKQEMNEKQKQKSELLQKIQEQQQQYLMGRDENQKPEELITLLLNIQKEKKIFFEQEIYQYYYNDQFNLANHYLEAGNNEAAQKLIQDIIENCPETDVESLYLKTETQFLELDTKQQGPEEVIQKLNKIEKSLMKFDETKESLQMARLHNIYGNIYFKALSKVEDAGQHFQKSCELFDKLLETETSKTQQDKIIINSYLLQYSVSLTDLGNFHSSMRNKEKALECFEVSKRNYEKIYEGEDKSLMGQNPEYINVLNQLGQTLAAFGDLKEGLKIQEEAKGLFPQPVPKHMYPIYFQVLNGLSYINYLQSNYEKALEYIEQIQQFIILNQYQAMDVEMYTVYDTKILILMRQKKFEEALKQCDSVLQQIEQNKQTEQHIYLSILNSKGQCFMYLKDYEQSKDVGKQIHSLSVKRYGDESDITAEALKMVGLSNMLIGKIENREDLLIECKTQLDIVAKVLRLYPSKIRELTALLQEQMNLYLELKNRQLAYEYGKQVIEAWELKLKYENVSQQEIDKTINMMKSKIEQLK